MSDITRDEVAALVVTRDILMPMFFSAPSWAEKQDPAGKYDQDVRVDFDNRRIEFILTRFLKSECGSPMKLLEEADGSPVPAMQRSMITCHLELKTILEGSFKSGFFPMIAEMVTRLRVLPVGANTVMDYGSRIILRPEQLKMAVGT